MPFEIQVDEEDDIIEIVYPASPSKAEVDDYLVRVRAVLDARKRPYSCLVDQRKLPVLPPELADRFADLNVYAAGRGMQRSARIVSTAIAGLQAQRMSRQSGVALESFTTREEAIAWLKGERPSRPR